jgi:hypothetical protein
MPIGQLIRRHISAGFSHMFIAHNALQEGPKGRNMRFFIDEHWIVPNTGVSARVMSVIGMTTTASLLSPTTDGN